MMNNGSTASRNDGAMTNPDVMINNLNTYIYDYFLKRGYHDCARALVQDESVKLNTDNNPKTSPGNRRDDVNGMDPDAMMTDKDGEKIKIPDDLPRPSLPSESPSSFLLDWFSLFWDFFWAQRKKTNGGDIRQYLQHNQVRRPLVPSSRSISNHGHFRTSCVCENSNTTSSCASNP
jgi:hypothetical protein